MKVLNLFCSLSGNTEKVASQIAATTGEQGHEVVTVEVTSQTACSTVDFLDYELIFAGSGVYSWLPPKPMISYIEKQNKRYMDEQAIHPCSPRLAGRRVITYCTFGGPHTGVNEAVTTPKFLGQLFEHLGFEIVAEWHFPGEFRAKGFQQYSSGGRMGDITGRPDVNDLSAVAELVKGILGM